MTYSLSNENFFPTNGVYHEYYSYDDIGLTNLMIKIFGRSVHENWLINVTINVFVQNRKQNQSTMCAFVVSPV